MVLNLKKKKKKKKIYWPSGTVENQLLWPELARPPKKCVRASGHIANVKPWILCQTENEMILRHAVVLTRCVVLSVYIHRGWSVKVKQAGLVILRIHLINPAHHSMPFLLVGFLSSNYGFLERLFVPSQHTGCWRWLLFWPALPLHSEIIGWISYSI